MHNVYDTLRIANDARHPMNAAFRTHVRQAITAATEAAPPADAAVPNLYYWRTQGHKGPGKHTALYTTLQGLDFYIQTNLD